MNLSELLSERGLTKALIIDDAYDPIPLAEDLVADDGAWSIFLDDVRSEEDKIVAVFPEYADLSADALRASDAFVSVVWGLRETLAPEVWQPLFEKYQQSVDLDRTFLASLTSELEALGIQIITGGRTIPQNAKEADIVFVDLFLGASQVDPDMERSLTRVNELLDRRRQAPPVVVLMSRSDRLKSKKADFRDRARLLGAMFRVHNKNDLLDGITLSRTLERLAIHRPDALCIATFISSWEDGLTSAVARFMSVVRRLDLSDYAQVQQVLLEFEGQPLGSYLMDVFDRVLQHEIEADHATLQAAVSLNSIDTRQYPAPYVAGSPDLQELAYRCIWQHRQRLNLKATELAIPVSFGDVLIAVATLDNLPNPGLNEPNARVVLTPPCDLVRARGAKRIVLMSGVATELSHSAWQYKNAGLRTPIIVLPDDRRMWVAWNTKDIATLSPSEVSALIAQGGAYRVANRLRESHALELQQSLLADLGRVGVLAQMPATFAVRVTATTVRVDGGFNPLNGPTLSGEGGVCYTGRDADGLPYTRLLLTETAADELALAIKNINEATIHPKAKGALQRLMQSSFLSDLQRGIPVPTGQGWTNINARLDDKNVEVGIIARNPDQSAPTPGRAQQLGALVLLLEDIVTN